MKKYKKYIMASVIVIAALFVAFFAGDNPPTEHNQNAAIEYGDVISGDKKDRNLNSNDDADGEKGTAAGDEKTINEADNNNSNNNHSDKDKADENDAKTADNAHEQQRGDAQYSKENGMNIDEKTGEDEYKTEPVPEGKPVPVEPRESRVGEREMTCVLSVRCDTILNNMSALNPDKYDLIPSDGVILSEREVVFYEGESVFNVTLREMKKNKIHMEFVNTPIYNSAYIEGINNIYEFDCGELSGWLYSVNGWFPNYGCSRYALKQGDKIEWQYTCDLGRDIGGYISSDGGQHDE